MTNLFGFLLLGCIILLIVGLVLPQKSLFWFKGIKDRKTVLKFYGIGILVSFIGFGIVMPKKTEKIKEETVTENNQNADKSKSGTRTYNADGKELNRTEVEKIEYEVLREWNPDKDDDAIGMDILIDKKYATEEKIKELINQIVNEDVEKANVLIFTTKNAWEEGERGSSFTNDYKKSYIAC